MVFLGPCSFAPELFLEPEALFLAGALGVELEAVGEEVVGGAASEICLKPSDVSLASLFVLRGEEARLWYVCTDVSCVNGRRAGKAWREISVEQESQSAGREGWGQKRTAPALAPRPHITHTRSPLPCPRASARSCWVGAATSSCLTRVVFCAERSGSFSVSPTPPHTPTDAFKIFSLINQGRVTRLPRLVVDTGRCSFQKVTLCATGGHPLCTAARSVARAPYDRVTGLHSSRNGPDRDAERRRRRVRGGSLGHQPRSGCTAVTTRLRREDVVGKGANCRAGFI